MTRKFISFKFFSFFIFSLFLFSLFLFSCFDDSSDSPNSSSTLDSISIKTKNAAKGTTNLSVPLGQNLSFVATGVYGDKTQKDLSKKVTWKVDKTNLATIDKNGLLTAVSQGVIKITATFENTKSKSLSVTISPAALTSIAISTNIENIAVGFGNSFSATGYYSDNTSFDLTNSVSWQSADNNVLTVDAAGKGSALLAGGAQISSQLDGITSNLIDITVANSPISAINLNQDNVDIKMGESFGYTAVVVFDNGFSFDITGQSTWISADEAVATVSQMGVITPVSPGTTTISVTRDGTTRTTGLTISPATLEAIAISTANLATQVGNDLQFMATGHFSDNTTADITNSVTWSSSDANIATIDSSGLLTPVTQGLVQISALDGAVNSNVLDITINPATLVSFAISSASDFVIQGGSTQLRQLGRTVMAQQQI